jgi:hypothetical protein
LSRFLYDDRQDLNSKLQKLLEMVEEQHKELLPCGIGGMFQSPAVTEAFSARQIAV